MQARRRPRGLPVAVALFSLLAAGLVCGRSADESLGEPFVLKPGESASVRGENLRIRFDLVLEDSRCPKDVQCIRAGTARVRLEIAVGSAAPESVDVEAPGESSFGELRVTLEGLEPYPVSGRRTPPDEYLVKISVDKR